ncbi:MAG: hypothetical protein KDA71_13130, partial [Planctomycetales bacterium]|nr:hypothetical protein [Planctomycetales bacterium]
MTTSSKRLTNPTDWHKKPRNASGPCPICGLSATQPGEHRATTEAEGNSVWIKRRRRNGEWHYTEVGSRIATRQAPTKQLAKAAEVLVAGGTFKAAAAAAGVVPSVLRAWHVQHSHAWGLAFADALAAIDPTARHRKPRGYDLCPVCGSREVGPHRSKAGELDSKTGNSSTSPARTSET